jgi:hypothetical protein
MTGGRQHQGRRMGQRCSPGRENISTALAPRWCCRRQRFRLDTGRWTAAQCDAGFGARTSCVRTGSSGAAIRTACELDERRSSGMMTSSDRGQQAARQDLHGGAAPCEMAAGSAASSSPDTRAFGQRGRDGGFGLRRARTGAGRTRAPLWRGASFGQGRGGSDTGAAAQRARTGDPAWLRTGRLGTACCRAIF